MFISILEHRAMNIFSIVLTDDFPMSWGYIPILCAYGTHLYCHIYGILGIRLDYENVRVVV